MWQEHLLQLQIWVIVDYILATLVCTEVIKALVPSAKGMVRLISSAASFLQEKWMNASYFLPGNGRNGHFHLSTGLVILFYVRVTLPTSTGPRSLVIRSLGQARRIHSIRKGNDQMSLAQLQPMNLQDRFFLPSSCLDLAARQHTKTRNLTSYWCHAAHLFLSLWEDGKSIAPIW